MYQMCVAGFIFSNRTPLSLVPRSRIEYCEHPRVPLDHLLTPLPKGDHYPTSNSMD